MAQKKSKKQEQRKSEKYSVDDLRGLPKDEKLVKVGLMIANELHNLTSTLRKIKKKE